MNTDEYSKLVQSSTYIKNLNTGIILSDKPQAGLSLNTGQMYNNKAQEPTPMEDGLKAQSNFANIKNTF